MESLYYTLDEAAKAMVNNKFYVEQDAIDAALKAAMAFKYPIKVWVWNSKIRNKYYEGSDAVHFATVYSDGRVENQVNKLEAVAFALEARGLNGEADEVYRLINAAVFTKTDKLPVELEDIGIHNVDVSAKFITKPDVKSKSEHIYLAEIKFNGVADASNEYLKTDFGVYTPDNVKKVSDKLFADYKKYPPFFDKNEFKKFKLAN